MLNLQQVNPFCNLKARSLFLWFFVITIPVSFASELIASFIGFNTKDPIVTEISFCLSFGLLCLWALQRCRQLQINPKDMMGKLPPGYQWLPIAGLVATLMLFSLGAALLSFYFLSLLAPGFLKSLLNSISADSFKSSLPIYYNLFHFFAVVVFAPITEEFIFRGVLLHRWNTKWGIKPAILVSSIVFGFCHVNPVGLSVFGIVMSLLYLQSRTLMVPMVAHALNNAVVVGLGFLPKSASALPKSASAATTVYFDWRLGLLCIALSAPFLIRFIYKKWPDQRVSLPYWLNRKSRKLGQQGFN